MKQITFAPPFSPITKPHMPVFTTRCRQQEWMDRSDLHPDTLRGALEDLIRINHYLDGYVPVRRALAGLLSGIREPVSLLEVGSGAGDVAAHIATTPHLPPERIEVTGIDLLPEAIEFARDRFQKYPNLRFRNRNLFDLRPERDTFDVVVTTLTLHHFFGERLRRALQQLYSLSRLGVVIVDLHRHPLPYGIISVLVSLFARSEMVKHDAPLSVRRAFTPSELREEIRSANLPDPVIRWYPSFRISAIVPRSRTIDSHE